MNKLVLDRDLYSKEAIDSAVLAFNGLVDIRIETDANHAVCTFSNSEYPVEITMKEFENYIIDFSNSKRLYT